jgi:hypothetical protein
MGESIMHQGDVKASFSPDVSTFCRQERSSFWKSLVLRISREEPVCARKVRFVLLLRELWVERTRMITRLTGDGNVTREQSMPGKRYIWEIREQMVLQDQELV